MRLPKAPLTSQFTAQSEAGVAKAAYRANRHGTAVERPNPVLTIPADKPPKASRSTCTHCSSPPLVRPVKATSASGNSCCKLAARAGTATALNTHQATTEATMA
jgi:hypothetical protein